ncbi:MAG: glycerol-3-phosphate dehydrogenase subunit GlpB [Anaerolineales bacterium]|nr:glycerol-3-phosphate dehydrogenase subunit GlpB [Anaerolineales bacterium]
MSDLLVIGAGLSGLMAAYTAVKAGLSVNVVAKGLGSMHWSAATIDVLGYSPAQPETAVKRPLEQIPALIKANPQHPYALLTNEHIAQALAAFVALSKDVGVPYGGAANPGDNLLLPSPAGAARPAYLAPKGQLAGDLSRSEPMLIVGFEGLRDFFPELIAENLNKLGYSARAAFLPLKLATNRRDFTNVQLAQGMDSKEQRALLGPALKKLLRPGERIGLPAILGIKAHATVLAELERETGAPVFEIPTLPPSVPGVRLYTALRSYLQNLGVHLTAGMEVIHASAVAPNGTPGSIQWVESATSSRPLKLLADKFLLATGGILGGGFNSEMNGRVWETIFDLPLTVPQNRADWFQVRFISPEGHPVFSGGVTVNKAFQPTAGEQPIYGNLWAAGNLLGHCDTIQERSMEGIAIATGVAAAQALSS